MADDTITLDDIDRAILYELQIDARNTTNAEISEKVGVSATTVGQRIENLEDSGIIVTYHTMVNYERAGFPHRVLLFCTVHPDDRYDAADEILHFQGVISVRELISGECNLHIEAVGRTRDEIVETISTIEKNGVDVIDTEMIKNEWRQPFDNFDPQHE